MSPDPHREESTRITGAVRVSALWVQRALNEVAHSGLVEDGDAGEATFAALDVWASAHRLNDVEPRAGIIGDDVLMSTALEDTLVTHHDAQGLITQVMNVIGGIVWRMRPRRPWV